MFTHQNGAEKQKKVNETLLSHVVMSVSTPFQLHPAYHKDRSLSHYCFW